MPTRRAPILLLSAAVACTHGSDAAGGSSTGASSDAPATAGGGSESSAAAVTSTSDGTTSTDAPTGSSGGDDDTSTGEDPPPPPQGICDGDGSCAFPETCAACPDECGSCDVSRLPNQRPKYVDPSCAQPGDGLADVCAPAAGQPGRFVDLQVALDTLQAGDTLYLHPGDYWQEQGPFLVSGIGTAEAPIVITAAVPEDPPVLHSWDPALPDDNARSHQALGGAEQPIAYTIIDHVRVDGLLRLHGDHTRVQHVECTHGWEVCDGNWSCIRLEACTDCVAHHNWVHDVADTTQLCAGAEIPPRAAGFKEFDGIRTIWEFNTVENTAQWGYDLHRSSVDSIARFNLFRDAGPYVAIRMNRSGNQVAYANVVIGGGGCIDFVAEDPGDGFANTVDHNTCLSTAAGIRVDPFSPATVTHNVFGGIGPGSADNVILAAADPQDGIAHHIDRNAYDENSSWTTQMYEAPYYETLAEWQANTEYDDGSIAAAGGPCTFVDPPSDSADAEFDVTIADGACATLADDGGPVGACAVTACIGHDCRGCGF
ncbi:MAG: hypothetical protein U0168_12780 [Nannocystaceae bacterium]|jgi:hypothetical protein